MSRKRMLIAAATSLAIALALALGVADAAFGATDIAKNVGDEVRSWATGLLLAVAALVGLPALLRRDVSQGLVIVVLVVIVGGFVFANRQVESTIRTMWNTVAGTTDSGRSDR